MRRWNRYFVVMTALILSGMGPGRVVAAPADPTSTSASYQVVESEIGGNGQFDAASSNYSIVPNTDDGGATLGENAVGNSASTNYQSNAGFNTSAQPALTFVVSTSLVDLGVLQTTQAHTATATFSVKNYTSYGYAVTIIGSPPSHSGHALSRMTSPGASQATVEQFGINMRANTSPVTFGSDPVPVPGAAFSLYDPTVVIPANYRTPNNYMYQDGDTIAQAPRSSGETDYTISFLANISNTTPGGKYTGNLTLVATGTY